jgi:hypothetical protein
MAERETLQRGQCHCGAVAVRFFTRKAANELPLRACQCSFCRKHGARTTADPAGRAEIAVADPGAVERYRFALGTADYFVCRRCGVYVAAVMTEAGKSYAVLNVNAFADAASFAGQGAPMVYDHEDEAARRARRRKQWTPAVIL